LSFQNVFDGVAGGAVAAGVGGDPVGFGLYFGASVLYGNGEAAAAHDWQVDDIVTYKGGFGGGDSLFLEDLAEDACLVLNALVDVVDFQIAGAEGDSLRQALGDHTRLQPCKPRQRDGCSVMRVKALGFDQAGALETESAFTAVLIGLLQDALL
jgi:hypothetical protein